MPEVGRSRDVTVELQRLPLFADLDADVVARVAERAFVRRLARNQVLFVDGEPTDHLYVVRSGALKVHLTSENGTELLLALIGPGSSLGEVGLVDAGPRSAAVTALADCELLAVPGDAVREVLHAHPEAVWAVARALAASVRRLTRQTADLVFLDLPRRLAKLLLDSAVPDPDGVPVVHLPVTQTELAAMLGVTRQSLNKALSGLAGRGWVELHDRTVRLDGADALRRFART